MGLRRSEMKRSRLAVALLILGLVLGLAASLAGCDGDTATTTAAEVTTTTAKAVADTGQTWNLKFSYGVPSASSLGMAYMKPWADAVTKATGGRVTIEHYSDGTLCKDEQQYDYLLSGASDIAVVEPEYTAGTFRVFEMGSLPRLFPDPAVCAATMWDVADKYGDEMTSVKLLAITCIAGAQYIGDKVVHVPADIAGQKMRNGGKIESWTLSQLGAEAIDIELGDLGTSLERGVADAAFLSWSMIFISGAVRFTEYRTHLDLMYRTWLICMNKDVWDSMPPNIQEAVMSVGGKVGSTIYSVANEMATNESRTTLEKADVKLGNPPIYEPTAEEIAQWTEAVKPVWQRWSDELASSNSPYATKGQEILDFVTSKFAEYSTYYEKYKADAQKVLDLRPKSQSL
jgi:TRAP-type C4-dicarboxylate transport system substrate-binding protein